MNYRYHPQAGGHPPLRISIFQHDPHAILIGLVKSLEEIDGLPFFPRDLNSRMSRMTPDRVQRDSFEQLENAIIAFKRVEEYV